MAKFPAESGLSTITVVADTRMRSTSGARVRGDAEYIEAVYLQILGARQIVLYRRLLRELAASPTLVVELSIDELAQSFALPRRAILAAIKRLVDFDVVRWTKGTLEVPGLLPLLPDQMLPRLSASALACHLRAARALRETA